MFTKRQPADTRELKKKIKRKPSKQMSDENRAILDFFLTLEPGESFDVPIPERLKGDGDTYAKRVASMLSNQGRKDRKAFANPDNPSKEVTVERTTEDTEDADTEVTEDDTDQE